MNLLKRINGVVAALLFFPASALADVPNAFKEYVTYGNFNQVSNSFQRLALIMSDDGIVHYMLIAFLLAVFFWAAIALFRFFSGAPVNGTVAQGLIILLVGTFVYFAFVRPTSDMAVYDEVSNRHVVVGDVPDAVVLVAGVQNMFVNSIIDIIWTSSDPLSYRQNAGGDIFNILQNVFDVRPFIPSTEDSSGEYLNKSIAKLWGDCSGYAMNSSGGGFDVTNLHEGMTVIEMLQTLQSNTQYTTYYDDTHTAGVSKTCSEAIDEINNDLNALAEVHTGQKFWRERCGDSGYYDQTSTIGDSAYAVCKQKVVDFMLLESSGVTGIGIVREMIVASSLWQYIKNYDIQGLADFKINSALRGEAATAAAWLPIIKGTVFSVFIGVLPFLFILLPTMLFNKVFQFILGIFAFMISWELADAILHSYAMDQAMAIVEDVMSDKLSLYDIFMMQGESVKALLLFGKLRWASMMLAAVLASIVGLAGGYAMAHFAGGLNFAGYGDQGAREILDPEARAHDLNTLPNTVPTEAVTNEYGYRGMQQMGYMGQRAGMQASSMIMAGAGGSYGGSQIQAEMSHDNYVKGKADLDARVDVAEQTGFSPYEQSRLASKEATLTSTGRGASIDGSNPGDVMSNAAVGKYAEQFNALHQRAMDDIMTHGGVTPETMRAHNDLLTDTRTGHGNSEAYVAFHAGSVPVNATMTDEQKANYVDWHNRVHPEDRLAVDDVSSTGQFTFGLDRSGNLEPRFISTQEGHTSSVYANTVENVGSDYNASIADDLASGSFVHSNIDVLGHKDVVISKYANALSTYYNEIQYESTGYGANLGAGRGGIGVGGNMSKSNTISENEIATDMHDRLSSAQTNYEARQIMQNAYNEYVDYAAEGNFNVPSVKDVEDFGDNAVDAGRNVLEDVKDASKDIPSQMHWR